MNVPVDIREVIVCDDIRREDNGKAIIVGVYVGVIVPPFYPINMAFSFWLQGAGPDSVPDSVSNLKMKVEAVTEDGSPQAKGQEMDIPMQPPRNEALKERAVMVINHVPVRIEKPGYLSLKVFEQGQWIELSRKQIGYRPEIPFPG